MGWKNLTLDDYLMLPVGAGLTLLLVSLHSMIYVGGSNMFLNGETPDLTPAEIHARIIGSKWVLVSEQAMLNTIYTLKACLLLLYWRLTNGLNQQRAVKIIAIYTACSWLATELAYFTQCLPFSDYWSFPAAKEACATYQPYLIVSMVFNISSDVFILGILVPLLVTMNLPLTQKLTLIFIFSLGAFVVLIAILGKYYDLHFVFSTIYILWYVREATVAVCVSNVVLIWPLLREWFSHLRGFIVEHYTRLSTGRGSKNGHETPASDENNVRRNTSSPILRLPRKQKSEPSYLSGTLDTETKVNSSSTQECEDKALFDELGISTHTVLHIDIESQTRTSELIAQQRHDLRMFHTWEEDELTFS